MKHNRVLTGILLVCSLLAFVGQQIYFYDQFIDDSYISFRYARNLAEGRGLVFNPDEKVEGYSNFTWVLLLSAFIRMGGDVQIWAKISGALFGLFAIVATYFLVLRALTGYEKGKGSFVCAALAVLLLSANTHFNYWSSLGLETSLFTFLLTLSCVLFLGEMESSGKFPLSALAFMLVILSRPEGLYFLFSLFLIRSYYWKKGRAFSKRDILWLILVMIPFCFYLFWKIGYYGRYYPNTYYAKVPPLPWESHARATNYLLSWFKGISGTNMVLFLFSLISGIIFFKTGSIILIVPICYIFLYTYIVDADWMGSYRFLVPAMPFLYSLACMGGLFLFNNIREKTKYGAWIVLVILGFLFCAHFYIHSSLRHDAAYMGKSYVTYKEKYWFIHLKRQMNHGFNPPLQGITEILVSLTEPKDHILFPDIGFLGYSARCRIMDSRGLTDRVIADYIYAHSRKRNADEAERKFLEVFFLSRPDIVCLVLMREEGKVHHFVDETIKKSPRFQTDYQEFKNLPYYGNTNLVFFSRKDWKGPENTETVFQRYRDLIRENPHVPHFYATFIKMLSIEGRKEEAQRYYGLFATRFPALVDK